MGELYFNRYFNFLINDNYFRAIPPDLEFKSMVVQSLFSISWNGPESDFDQGYRWTGSEPTNLSSHLLPSPVPVSVDLFHFVKIFG